MVKSLYDIFKNTSSQEEHASPACEYWNKEREEKNKIMNKLRKDLKKNKEKF